MGDDIFEGFEEEKSAGKVMPRPSAPSQEEIDEHEVSHLPFRTWCSHCVRCKAGSDPHFRLALDDKTKHRIPSTSIDYFFMGSEGLSFQDPEIEKDALPLVAQYDESTRCTFAHACPAKGANQHVAQELAEDITWLGHKKLIAKSDQEPAILALKRLVAGKTGNVEHLPEESPVNAHGANGAVEGAIRRIAAQIRCLKDVLEHRYKMKVSSRHPVMAWLVTYAADMLTRFGRGKDGRTPWELSRGKPYRRRLLPFGETCLFMVVKGSGARQYKLDTRWQKGVYVGIVKRSDELIVLTPQGVRKARSIRRLPGEERHDKAFLESCKGVPWDKQGKGQVEEEPVEILPAGIEAPVVHDTVPIVEPVAANKAEPAMRRTYIRSNVELRNYSFTPGCTACDAIQRGKRSTNHLHSEACRARIEARIAADHAAEVQARAQKTRERENEALAEQLEKDPEEQRRLKKRREEAGSAMDDGNTGPMAQEEPAVPRVGSTAPGAAGTPVDTPMEAPAGPGAASSVGTPALDASGSVGSPASASVGTPASQPTGQPQDRAPKRRAEEGDENPREHKSQMIAAISLRKEIQQEYGGSLSSLECMEMSRNIKTINAVGVTEVFSPPRFTAEAPFAGLTPGTAFDLQTGWDLGDDRQFAQARATAAQERPHTLTGSPPCAAFSQIQGINFAKMSEERVRMIWQEGTLYLDRAITMYEDQLDRGGYILHEHPWGASSWKTPRMQALINRPGMYLIKGCMCHWDMQSVDGQGVGLVKKETGYLTNCPELAKALRTLCSNVTGTRPWHRHVPLLGGGRAAKAAVYPPKMVRAVLGAIVKQMRADNEICHLEAGGPSPHEPMIDVKEPAVAEELHQYWDDVRGGWLQDSLVQKARQEEVDQVRKHNVIDIVPRQRLIESGKKALDTVWVDTNKGTADRPDYRSRMCAREIKARQKLGLAPEAGHPSDLFASMPPYEAVKLIFSLYASRRRSRAGKVLKIGLYDVKRAHFNAAATRPDLFIEVPTELVPEGVDPKTVIGVLIKSMYGTRDAGANWEKEITDCLISGGFVQGVACPNLYRHEEKDIDAAVHGDDGHVLADEDGQAYVQKLLTERYEIKVRAILGPEPQDEKEVTFLNRTVRITEDNGIEIEADPKHAVEIARSMGVEGGKPVGTPIIKEAANTAEQELPALDHERKKIFRSTCMRACYLSMDRFDIQYTVKECAREMHNPTERGWARLKRLARYLVGAPRMIISYERQHLPDKLRPFTDSDHAGCKLTRKSTSGLCVMFGSHCIKTSATTQSTIGLSSPESEYYALVKGASAGLGIQALLADLNKKVEVHCQCDASSGISLASRRGLGRARHVSARYLWIQQRVAQKEVFVHKVPRKLNPSDLGTRCNTEAEIDEGLRMCNIRPAMSMSKSKGS